MRIRFRLGAIGWLVLTTISYLSTRFTIDPDNFTLIWWYDRLYVFLVVIYVRWLALKLIKQLNFE